MKTWPEIAQESGLPCGIVACPKCGKVVEKGTDLVDVLDKLIHPAFVGYTKIEAARAALAALKAMEG